jgi:hypothetical protein
MRTLPLLTAQPAAATAYASHVSLDSVEFRMAITGEVYVGPVDNLAKLYGAAEASTSSI